jgi:hypothetical protein
MKILTFCPTYRLEPEVVDALARQTGVEYFDTMFTHDNPYDSVIGGYYKNIQINYEKMRDVALFMGYDKVWIVEADTIPPVDALSKMLAVSAPVVTGLYVLRHGQLLPNVFKGTKDWAMFNQMTWEDVASEWGNVVDSSGGCMGCLLVDTEVLKGFHFVTHEKYAPDVPFMEYCVKNRIPQKAHLGVACGHKGPDGTIYWPTQKGVKTEKVPQCH